MATCTAGRLLLRLAFVAAAVTTVAAASAAPTGAPATSGTALNGFPAPAATENSGQTHVYTSASYRSIGRLDAENKEVSLDLLLTIYWCDARLPVDPKVQFDSARGWVPSILPVNARANVRQIIAQPWERISIDALPIVFAKSDPFDPAKGNPCRSWVTGNLRYLGSFFLEKIDLKEFPFDFQSVGAMFESALWPSSTVQLIPVVRASGDSTAATTASKESRESVTTTTPTDTAAGTAMAEPGSDPDSNLSGNDTSIASSLLLDEVLLTEWAILGSDVKSSLTAYQLRPPVSRMSFAITLQRSSAHFIYKLILPSILVCLIVIAFHSMKIDKLPRITSSMRGFSVMVALVFVSSNSIPKLGYLTRLDKFMAYNYLFLFALVPLQLHWYLLQREKLYATVIGPLFGIVPKKSKYKEKEKEKEKDGEKETENEGTKQKKKPEDASAGLSSRPCAGSRRVEPVSSSSVTIEMTDIRSREKPAAQESDRTKPNAATPTPEVSPSFVREWWSSMSKARTLDFVSACSCYGLYAIGAAVVLSGAIV